MENGRRGLFFLGSATAMIWLCVATSGVVTASVMSFPAETVSPKDIPKGRRLQYPFPATVQKLNRNAIYTTQGKAWKYTYRSNDGSFNFSPLSGGSPLNVASLDNIQVQDDPLAQALEDAKLIGELVDQAKNRRSDLAGTVDEFIVRGQNLTAQLKQALKSWDHASVKRTEKAFRHEYANLRKVYASVMNVQQEMQRDLNRGKELLAHLGTTAKKLLDNETLKKVLRMYGTQLQNEVMASERERGSTEAFISQSNEVMNQLQKEFYDGMASLEKHKEILQKIEALGSQVLDIDHVREQMQTILTIAKEIKARSADAEKDSKRGLVRVDALSHACTRSEMETKTASNRLQEIKTTLLRKLDDLENQLKGAHSSQGVRVAREALEAMRGRIQQSADSAAAIGQECNTTVDEARAHLSRCKKRNAERIRTKISEAQWLLQRTNSLVGQSQSDSLGRLERQLEESTTQLKELAPMVDNNFEDFPRISAVALAAERAAAALADFEKNFKASAAQLQEAHQLMLRELEELQNACDAPQSRLQIGSVVTELKRSFSSIDSFSERVSSPEIRNDFKLSLLAFLRRPLSSAAGNIDDAKRQEALVTDLSKRMSEEVAAYRRVIEDTEAEAEKVLRKHKQKGSHNGANALPEDPAVWNEVLQLRRKQIQAVNRLTTNAEAAKVKSDIGVAEMEKEIGDTRRMIEALRECLANKGVVAAIDEIGRPGTQGKNSTELLHEAELLEKKADQLQIQVQRSKDAVSEREKLLDAERKKLLETGSEFIPHFLQLLKKAVDEALKEGTQLEAMVVHVERLAHNSKARRAEDVLIPPPTDGSVTNEEAAAEAEMDADSFFRAASTQNDKLQGKLKEYHNRLSVRHSDVDEAKALLQALLPQSREVDQRQSSGRRLSSSKILTEQQLGEYSQDLVILEEILTKEEQKIRDIAERGRKAIADAARAAAADTHPENEQPPQEANKDSGPSQGLLLGIGLGIGIPLAIASIAMWRCYGRKKKPGVGSSIAPSEDRATSAESGGSDTSRRARSTGPDHLESIRISTLEFGDLETAFSGVEHPEIAGIVARETLPTPPAGEPDTTHMQYMIDDHYTVARNISKEVEHKFDFEGFPTAVVREQRPQSE
uniref:Myosin heavy chain, putative n=1 Tax=Neospora caninum (strain Liverpool) TaxID=572307 RepID=A0A0F7U7Q9_NEOCL|nr:TPA: myosin heavy chain, putative [Neospora caninum Liverpool]